MHCVNRSHRWSSMVVNPSTPCGAGVLDAWQERHPGYKARRSWAMGVSQVVGGFPHNEQSWGSRGATMSGSISQAPIFWMGDPQLSLKDWVTAHLVESRHSS